jgi:hypothetical protein
MLTIWLRQATSRYPTLVAKVRNLLVRPNLSAVDGRRACTPQNGKYLRRTPLCCRAPPDPLPRNRSKKK